LLGEGRPGIETVISSHGYGFALARRRIKRDRSRLGVTEKKTSAKERKWRILTPIDEAVVILLICLVAIPFFLENDRGYAFQAAVCIIVQIDLTQRADGSLEKLL
jgi:hypothetical protein